MTGFFPLLKLQLLSRFADFKPKNLKTALKEKKGRTIGMFIAILFLIIYMGAILIIVEQQMLNILADPETPAQFRMPDMLVTMAVMLTTLGTLIMAFFFIMSSLYLGRDAAYIAALPVKTRTVLSAKLVQVWVSETLIDAVILLPACIQYGIRVGESAGFYLRMVLVWLTAAMLPIAIITFVSALLIRISALWKHKELMATVGGIAFFIAYMFLMMNVGRVTGDAADGGEMIRNFVMSYTSRIDSMTGMFPPARWAVKGMLGDWGQLALFILVSLAAMALTVWLMGYVYRKLSLLQTETPVAKGKKGIRKGSLNVDSAFMANVKREFLQIIRVPSYAMNILPIAVMPLVMTIMFTVIIGNNMGDDGQSLGMLLDMLPRSAVMGILTAIMAYMSGMNPALSTAVSREGKGHDFLIGLPIQARTLIRAKFAVGFGLALCGVGLATVALLIIFPAMALEVVMAFILCALFSYANAMMALSHDIRHPRLTWTTEQEAVKQNFGVLISMLISWGILIALGIAAYFMISAGWDLWIVFGVLFAVLAVLCLVTRNRMYSTTDKYYCKQ